LERHERSTVVRLTGMLDVGAAPELERALSVVQVPGRRVLLDLRGVYFADSSGIRTVVAALVRAERIGGELRVLADDHLSYRLDAARQADPPD
jgi:anti-anti-sigma factor